MKTLWRISIYYFLYNLTLLIFSLPIGLYLIQRYASGKSKPGWEERWGHLPESLRRRPENSKPRLWMHAVSAGEVVAAVPILREIRARLPEYEILFSVITPAGHEMATQQASPYIDALFYFPFDLPWIARRVVRQINPQVFVSLESELWPDVLHELKRTGTVTVMVNGRISDKSFRRATRFGGGFFRWMLMNMDRLLMQSESDANRVRGLSPVLAEPGRVQVLGNSKFDQEIGRLTPEQVQKLRQSLGFPEEAPVFVAGSTRSPQEETEVLSAYKIMREQVPALCLLIAPRQIDRAEELAIAMQAEGLAPVRRTAQHLVQSAAGDSPDLFPSVSHVILDTMGELANVYAVATFAFVGNSLPPVVKGGGQNLLQPLAHGKPVLFGTHTATIRSEVALVQDAQVGFQIKDGVELAAQGLKLLQDPALCQAIEQRALALIASNRGVSVRYAEAVVALARGNSPTTGEKGSHRPTGMLLEGESP